MTRHDPADNELTEMPGTTDPELRRMLGLFDTPAFARRGQEVDDAIERLHARCRRQRDLLAEMPTLRLRQWARLATDWNDGADLFVIPLAALGEALNWPPLPWASSRPGPARHRRPAARDLAASVTRFNQRWTRFLADLDLRPVNRTIDSYNRYYLLEKECYLGSARLAALHFRPLLSWTPERLIVEYPPLPVPLLATSG